jgi:predicted NBD/HSP70 family sugar kinase
MRQSYWVGADVGGTRLRLIAANGAAPGGRSAVREIPVPRSAGAMVEAIADLTAEVTGGGHVAAAAIGLPGQVLGARCVWVPNLRFLDGVALGDLVSARLGAPCRLLNDAQATLVAEAHEGAATGHADVLLVAVGTGIGGAYQVGGRLVRGANGCAGAFGWLPFPGYQRDADHGAWERAASGQSLERLAAPWGGAEAMFGAARAGEVKAREVAGGFGATLGAGIAALASVLDPELVVFGGGLVSAFDILGDAVAGAVREHGSPAGAGVRLVPAALGGAAGVIGALLAAVGAGNGR